MAKLVHSHDQAGPLVPDPTRAVLVVTGSTLGAESHDRPAAYGLRDALAKRLTECTVVVCGDIWYLNQDELRGRPVVSVGSPHVNAFAAYLADRLPCAYAIDDELMVQADLEFDEPVASCWGVTHEATARAVAIFVERYLDAFVRSASRI